MPSLYSILITFAICLSNLFHVGIIGKCFTASLYVNRKKISLKNGANDSINSDEAPHCGKSLRILTLVADDYSN